MADRIDWENFDINDPRFVTVDTDNPNTNISASTFDVTDPTMVGNPLGERYNEFLRTASIGDTFYFGDKSGTKNTFTGFNKMGTPMLQTSTSEAYTNWRTTLGDTRDVSIGDAIKRLTDVGYSEDTARYLISVKAKGRGTPFVFTDGAGGLGGSDGSDGFGGSMGSGDSGDTVGPTTNLNILKAGLRGLGLSSSIIDSSTNFLNSLLKEGLDVDNATEVFLNNKEYTLKNGTKLTSPFYTQYGYLNEGLVVPKSANELFNTVEGYKGVVEKYKLSSKYLTQDNLKKYVKNNVTVANLAERAAMAELRAYEADPFQVEALIKQGYISSPAGLKDFYLDSSIGQEQLELNRQTGVFTAEALRRARLGVLSTESQLASFKKLTATLAAKGYSEAEISQLAATGFENISEDINPMSKFAGIYDKQTETLAVKEGLQTELQAEEFLGTASQRRKKYGQLEGGTFQASSGKASISKSSTAGIL